MVNAFLGSPDRCAGNVGYIIEYLHKQLAYIRLHAPFWERNGGRDHAYYLVQDRGGMDNIFPPLNSAMQICQFGARARAARRQKRLAPLVPSSPLTAV